MFQVLINIAKERAFFYFKKTIEFFCKTKFCKNDSIRLLINQYETMLNLYLYRVKLLRYVTLQFIIARCYRQ